jgi:PhzF family phenazine biosynthesis protein
MAEQIHVYKVNAFSNKGLGGNGAGVVLQAADLSNEKMQEVAAEVGYSETVFVATQPDGDLRLRFFTPTAEVDLCGHATLAAGAILKSRNELPGSKAQVVVNAGELALEAREDGEIFISMPTPELQEELDSTTIARILGLNEDQVTAARVVKIGTRQLIVPVLDRESLVSMRPNLNDMATYNRETKTMGMHIFTLDTQEGGVDALCRSFSPLYGINEESATGGASGALGLYLATFSKQKPKYVFIQGITMPNPSRITVAVTSNQSESVSVQVGGYATIVGKEDIA